MNWEEVINKILQECHAITEMKIENQNWNDGAKFILSLIEDRIYEAKEWEHEERFQRQEPF
jgi:hypothetical protein